MLSDAFVIQYILLCELMFEGLTIQPAIKEVMLQA